MSSDSSVKQRGLWLSIWLVLMMLHSFISALVIYLVYKGPREFTFPWLIALLFLASGVKLISVFGLWNWKQWGLYLYMVGVVATLIVGIILTGSLMIVFSDVLPLAILGWLIKDKLTNFT